jgi:hypothetical protein
MCETDGERFTITALTNIIYIYIYIYSTKEKWFMQVGLNGGSKQRWCAQRARARERERKTL